MSSDHHGASVLEPAPVSRFADTLMNVLDRVEYSRVRMDVTDNPVFRLRYEAYRREEWVPFNDAGIVVDDLDDAPNAMCFGVHIDGELVSSLRLHHLSSANPQSPSMSVFPEVLGPLLAQGQHFIDPTRFTADYEASLAYPALPFLTLRLAVMATEHFDVTACLALVRREHAAFYRRVFASEEMSESRPYPGLNFPVRLYGSNSARNLENIYRRFPFFRSTAEERARLFAREGNSDFDRLLPTSSRRAFEQVQGQTALAAE